MTEPVSSRLSALADAMGVATSYEDYLKRPVTVGAEAVRLALTAMGLDVTTPDAITAALRDVSDTRRQRALPASIVVRSGEQHRLTVSAPDVRLTTEDGAEQALVAGAGGEVVLPASLPLGYHRLSVDSGVSHLVVTPGACPLPMTRRGFGWMAQLYAVRSEQSWGIGDCNDLAELARFSGGIGAAMILVNPMHAAAPVLPQEASPYSPTSRRYRNPLYLRIEDIAEYARLSPDDGEVVAGLAQRARNASDPDRIDRDAAFTAKMAALELLFATPRSDEDQQAFRIWCEHEGAGLVDFATFCVLAEEHGSGWHSWPDELQHPASPAVARARTDAGARVEFHMWLQWLTNRQLATAQQAATDAGMAVGIVHDLAVGVDPGGADAWALQDDLATGMTVGAPPDGFNQRGQDWGLPPLLPQRLPDTGFQPFRDMLRSVLQHAGGIRIDHVMGLWRLWWVPQGRSAADGTYVSYPARDLLGVLALEAHRAGAMVVGEDLGTVQTGVREALAEHRILSSRVLYFERVDDDPDKPMLPAAQYPELALTSITTHDLPTASGWWADEEITVQTELGLFGEGTTPQQQRERKAAERRDMIDLLLSEGLVGEDPTDDEFAVAMHAFLARTPSLLVATGLGDAIGDRRQPNMPGTVDEYPNWRLPLARSGPQGPQPVGLEEFCADDRVRRVARLLAQR